MGEPAAKALVTGGAGFIGLHLARALADAGQEVTVVDNLSRGQEDEEFRAFLERGNVHAVRADLTEPSAYAGLERDYDHVYHLAAVNGTRWFYEIPDQVLRVNLLSTIHLLDWFTGSRCGKVLFGSSSEAYAGLAKPLGLPYPTPEEVPLGLDDPYNARWSYGGSKLAGELLVINYARQRRRRATIVRFTNVYGPRMGYDHVIPEFLGRILRREDPFVIHGAQPTRTFCYVEDAVRATRMVMDAAVTDGATLNVGSDQEELPMEELARRMLRLFGGQPRLEARPAPPGSVLRRRPDITRLRKLGYEPRVGLDEGLRRTHAWYAGRPWPAR